MAMTPDPNRPLAGLARAAKAAPAEGIPSTCSDVLLGQARQLRIEHAGEWYVLRQATNQR